MADQDSEAPQSVITALVASGFPLQTAVARIVSRVPDCAIVQEEYPWRDETGSDQFLDLVVRKHSFIVAIECKKTQKEALTFLQPDGSDGDVTRTRCLYLNQIQDSTKRIELFSSDWQLMPKSKESMFCVVSTTSSGKDQRLLERDAQKLIRGTDAYARQYKVDFKATKIGEPDRPLLPILVTNAKIYIAEYDSATVSLETGQFEMPPPIKLQLVPWVRFRKAFTSAARDLGARTIFVVSAVELASWLGRLDFVEQFASEMGKAHIQL